MNEDYSIIIVSSLQGMPATVLTIGLDPDLETELAHQNRTNIVTTVSYQEALELLATTDVSTILIDSRSSSQLRADINMLLADTPVTTSIVLITHPFDLVSAESYAALGVKTIHGPASVERIQEFLLT
ncbi:MAG: hypothetical protein WD356_08790 [Pseudomonadales bacterium]